MCFDEISDPEVKLTVHYSSLKSHAGLVDVPEALRLLLSYLLVFKEFTGMNALNLPTLSVSSCIYLT